MGRNRVDDERYDRKLLGDLIDHCHRQTSRDIRHCMAPGSDVPRPKVDTVVADANGLTNLSDMLPL